VEYGRFHELDPEVQLPDGSDAMLAAIGADLTGHFVLSGPGWVALHSAGNQHYANVELEISAAHAADPAGDWDEQAEVEVEFPNRRLQFWTVTAGPDSSMYELPEAKQYRMRIFSRGRAELVAALPLVDDELPDGIEEWLIQVFPAEAP